MDNVITLRLSKEKLTRLEAFMEKEGHASRGKAVKAIVEERLSLDEEYDRLEPLLDRIEDRVARAAQRGTKASLASLCFLTAREDKAMRAKLDAMPAGKIFGYAWDMAGALLTYGERPDFYKAAKHASLMRAREKTPDQELLATAASIPPMKVGMALDDADVKPWHDAMKDYLATRDLVEGWPAGSSDAWIVASQTYSKATKALLEILSRMNVQSVIDLAPFEEGAKAFSYEREWFDLHENIFEANRRRRRAKEAGYEDHVQRT